MDASAQGFGFGVHPWRGYSRDQQMMVEGFQGMFRTRTRKGKGQDLADG